jgi:hypothetical protein
MTTKPDFKFGDRVIHIGERQKRGVVSRVFRSGGVWWLAFEVNRTGGTRRGTSGEWLKAGTSQSDLSPPSSLVYRRARLSALAGGGALAASPPLPAPLLWHEIGYARSLKAAGKSLAGF